MIALFFVLGEAEDGANAQARSRYLWPGGMKQSISLRQCYSMEMKGAQIYVKSEVRESESSTLADFSSKHDTTHPHTPTTYGERERKMPEIDP